MKISLLIEFLPINKKKLANITRISLALMEAISYANGVTKIANKNTFWERENGLFFIVIKFPFQFRQHTCYPWKMERYQDFNFLREWNTTPYY